MKKAEAKKWCIKKWEYIVNNEGHLNELYKAIPELNNFESGCAYCELYNATNSAVFLCCARCPIRPKLKDYDDMEYCGCLQKIHPFDKWSDIPRLEKDKIKYAKELLELIKQS